MDNNLLHDEAITFLFTEEREIEILTRNNTYFIWMNNPHAEGEGLYLWKDGTWHDSTIGIGGPGPEKLADYPGYWGSYEEARAAAQKVKCRFKKLRRD